VRIVHSFGSVGEIENLVLDYESYRSWVLVWG
jgi:hypothetical protein